MGHEGSRRQQAAVLHPASAAEAIRVGRAAAPTSASPYVDYLWWVEWDTPRPHVQAVIPRPVLHVYAEHRDGVPRLLVTGVMTTRFDRRLEGRGRTVAAAFRPGGFRPVLGSSCAALRDREATVLDLLGHTDAPLAAHLLDAGVPVEAAAERLGEWLAALEVPDDPRVAELSALVDRAETDPTITRAVQLAQVAGVSLRTLQRRFEDYVGIGPRWVVRRCRLLDVAAAAHGAEPVDWADLAQRLGYADQSHLIRGFTALVGRPPATYVADQRRGPA